MSMQLGEKVLKYTSREHQPTPTCPPKHRVRRRKATVGTASFSNDKPYIWGNDEII
jgi:hypothetical protein